jgi:C-terminal processing protease CtpA/Prc
MIDDFVYLRFTSFPNDPEVAGRTRQFLLDHADARGVILDARDSRGGTLMVMDAILPLFFAERTTLMRMDSREGAGFRGPPPPGPAPSGGSPAGGPERRVPAGPPGAEPRDDGRPPTMVRQEAPPGVERFDHIVLPDPTEKRFLKTPVFYLTSKLTRSAAEHFAMALQRTHRGVLVGDVTAGAGNFGAPVPIGTRFSAFIPFGRSYDPDTNRGWEGTGITPDVSVPAAEALEEALRRGEK